MEYFFLINAMLLEGNGLEKTLKKLKFKNVLLPSKPLIRFARQVVISTCDNYFILRQTMSPHVKQSGFRYPGNFCLWTPESGIILHVQSGILSFGIWNTKTGENPVPGIRNPSLGIQNPRLSWIPLHEAITQPGYHVKVILTFTCTIVSPKTKTLPDKTSYDISI